MSYIDCAGELFYSYAMELFFKAGHVSTFEPEFINHSPEQFVYFDNKSDIAISREQRGLLKIFDNVSRLFTNNGCAFFSINLLTTRSNRSQAAHDIHIMIHPIVGSAGTICLFRNDDEVMLSFEGFGYRCFLSDWYPMEDDYDHLLERLDIANMPCDRGLDYFSDMVYSLARQYYLYSEPTTFEILPVDFITSSGIDEIDREELDRYIEYVLASPLREYGFDFVDYDESITTKGKGISAELDLLLLEIDDDNDNQFGEQIESSDYGLDEDESFEQDEYEFDDVDPEIFRDPSLMVKWIQKNNTK